MSGIKLRCCGIDFDNREELLNHLKLKIPHHRNNLECSCGQDNFISVMHLIQHCQKFGHIPQ